MHNLSTFQLISLGVFALLLLLGIGIFATMNGQNSGGTVGKVVIWGTVDANVMEQLLGQLRGQDRSSFDQVSYVQKDPSTYTTDLVNAMASGQAPDIFITSQDWITYFSDKVSVIPYSSVSQSTFTSGYVDEGRLFLTPQGALALPFTLDPLVLYWNRDLLSSAGVANPPAHWSDLLDIAPRITQLDANNTVRRSAIALGQWSNVRYAKDILAALFLQAGDPIVERSDAGVPTPVFGQTPQGATENPASSALQFYTEFTNPSKTIYSWNRALPDSQDAFVAGDVALYIGFASDYPTIVARNPNLHFSVALLPQIAGGGTQATFGQMSALAIPRTAPNPTGALAIVQKLTSQSAATALANIVPLPPARRDVTLDTSKNAEASIFAQSALIARGWLDPAPTQTDQAFADMIQSVTSSKADPAAAVFSTEQTFESILHTNSLQSQ